MNLFFDACVVIYLIEAKEPFCRQLQEKIQHITRNNPDARIAVSRLSILECLVNPLRDQDNKIIEQYRSFFARQELVIIDLLPEVVEKALWMRVNYNLRTPDALQAACALELPHGKSFFLTGDKTFKRVTELNVCLI